MASIPVAIPRATARFFCLAYRCQAYQQIVATAAWVPHHGAGKELPLQVGGQAMRETASLTVERRPPKNARSTSPWHRSCSCHAWARRRSFAGTGYFFPPAAAGSRTAMQSYSSRSG